MSLEYTKYDLKVLQKAFAGGEGEATPSPLLGAVCVGLQLYHNLTTPLISTCIQPSYINTYMHTYIHTYEQPLNYIIHINMHLYTHIWNEPVCRIVPSGLL